MITKVPKLTFRDLMETILEAQRPTVTVHGRASSEAFEWLLKELDCRLSQNSLAIHFADILIYLDANVRPDELYILTMPKEKDNAVTYPHVRTGQAGEEYSGDS